VCRVGGGGGESGMQLTLPCTIITSLAQANSGMCVSVVGGRGGAANTYAYAVHMTAQADSWVGKLPHNV
jgi:hypothetical protein